MSLFFNLAGVVLLSLFTCSCQTLDVRAIGTEQNFTPEEDERRLWKRSDELEEIIQKSGFVYEDKALQGYIASIAHNLTPQGVKNTGSIIKVYILKDPSFNAFIIPSGVMYVHTGLLASVENEAQIATILGHELSHFINRHGLKEFRNLKNMSALYSTLFMATMSLGLGDLSGILLRYGYLTSVTGYSQEMEYQADLDGFEALVRNNYDLSQAQATFEILDRDIREEEIKEPYFFSTHPKLSERIKNYKELYKGHKEDAANQQKIINADIYDSMIRGALLDNSALDIKKGRFKSAQRVIERFIRLKPDEARGYFALGELYINRKQDGDLEKAEYNYKKAIAMDSGFADPHREMGLIYYRSKKVPEAIAEFEAYLRLAPYAQDSGFARKYLEELRGKE